MTRASWDLLVQPWIYFLSWWNTGLWRTTFSLQFEWDNFILCSTNSSSNLSEIAKPNHLAIVIALGLDTWLKYSRWGWRISGLGFWKGIFFTLLGELLRTAFSPPDQETCSLDTTGLLCCQQREKSTSGLSQCYQKQTERSRLANLTLIL